MLRCGVLLVALVASPAAAPAPALGEVVASSGSWITDPLWPVPTTANSRGGLIGFSAGNHRAEVVVGPAAAEAPAVVARVEWRRRAAPAAETTAVVAVFNGTQLEEFVVVNATAHSALIAFSPRGGPGRYDFYYLPYSFSGADGRYQSKFATAPTQCTPSGAAATAWRQNHGTAGSSILHSSSGDTSPANAAWKVADGVLTFLSKVSEAACDTPPLCQGWNCAGGVQEWLVFDMGSCVTADGFALYAAGDSDHDPKTMYLEAGTSASSLAAGNGTIVGNFTGKENTTARQELSFPPHTARFWRWVSDCRWSNIPCPGYQTYLAEIEFKVSKPLPDSGAGGKWRHTHGLDGSPTAVAAAAAALPSAGPVNLTARTEWDAFTAMELMASPAEIATLLAKSAGNKAMLFPTARELAVRDFEGIPEIWANSGPSGKFAAVVEPSEYFTWQIGLVNPSAFGPSHTVPFNVTGYSVVLPSDSAVVAANLTCFNLGGVGYDGLAFSQPMGVSEVGSLWFGLQLPDALPTVIALQLTMHFDSGIPPATIDVTLTRKGGAPAPLAAHGDRDPTRLARLRWLNSPKGLDHDHSAQYEPVMLSSDDTTISIKNRSFVLAGSGHFSSIMSNGIELLAGPVQLLVTDKPGDTPMALHPTAKPTVTQLGSGGVRWTVISSGVGSLAGVSAHTKATLSYDGYVDYNITLLSTSGSRELADVRLVVPMTADVAKWAMGFNVMPSGRLDAQSSPINFSWQEYNHGQRNGAWVGKPAAGMRVLFKGMEAAWNSPIEMPSHPPGSWANCANPLEAINCKGNASVTSVQGVVLLQSSTGTINVTAGGLPFNFDLLVTPLRPVNLHQHFTTRYFQFGGEFPPPDLNLSTAQAVDQLADMGVTWVNIHQGSNLNPYINYPLRPDLMADLEGFVELCHNRNLSVKLYFTTRELTNRCSELFALKSLPNHEVLFGGPGGGGAWLGEHLVSDYLVRWSQIAYHKEPNNFWGLDPTLPGVRADEAIGDTGYSRWNNFYVEAVHFTLLESPKTDGLYLDGIAFDRSTIERVRKGMELAKSSVRIDIHQSNDGGCKNGGWGSPALKYMQHFAFADSLWFGEGFDYWGQSADWWLLEASGLPYGLTGDMIREGAVGANGTRNPAACPDPNRWLGLVFGMTARGTSGLGSSITSPEALEVVPLWSYMTAQKIENTQLHGWWEDAPFVSVSATAGSESHEVKATAFLQPDGVTGLIALANFGNEAVAVTLHAGKHALDLVSDSIEAFQPPAAFPAGAAIEVAGKGGWLLRIASAA